ncbi:hypothetical protein [Clostridium sp. Marseille-Q2269]|uniref:hypothetical protein n=1 Tax=Clostridium sp. Marseille-Q2269 TaxID=2942205 RepID=UPI0020741BDA|nr:hypothetical protein [Clostridium sp. Marseille-Q2269]
MTKGIRILIVFILVSMIVFSCTYNIVDDRKESEKVVRDYINLLYTVKPKKKTNRNMTLEQVYTKDVFGNLMTESAYHNLWKDQIPLVLSLIVNTNDYCVNVNKINVNNYRKNNDGTATYDYNVQLKIFSYLNKNHKEKKINGKITLKKIRFKWKVLKDRQFNLENIILEK